MISQYDSLRQDILGYAATRQGGRFVGQYDKISFPRICIKMEFCSARGEKRFCSQLDHQRGRRDVMCKPALRLTTFNDQLDYLSSLSTEFCYYLLLLCVLEQPYETTVFHLLPLKTAWYPGRLPGWNLRTLQNMYKYFINLINDQTGLKLHRWSLGIDQYET